MEENVQNYIYYDEIEPAKRIIRSDVVYYVLLLLAVLGSMFLSSLLQAYFGWSMTIVQICLFVILAVLIILIYKYRLLSCGYLLTERMFSVSKIVGRKIRPDQSVHLSDIRKICAFSDLKGDEGKKYGLFHGKREKTTALCCRVNGTAFVLLISPTEEMMEKLLDQWKKARQKH